MMRRKNDDLGILSEDMAAGILQQVGTLAVLATKEDLRLLYAALDACEETGGRMERT